MQYAAAVWAQKVLHYNRVSGCFTEPTGQTGALQEPQNGRRRTHTDEGGATLWSATKAVHGTCVPSGMSLATRPPCPNLQTLLGRGHQKTGGRTASPTSAKRLARRQRGAELFTQHRDRRVNMGVEKSTNRRRKREFVCLEQS